MAQLYPPIIAGIESALKTVFNDGRYADKVIEYQFKQNRKWGSNDRRLFSQIVYDITRWWRKLTFCLELPEVGPWSDRDFEKIVTFWTMINNIEAQHKGAPIAQDELNRAITLWRSSDLTRAIKFSIPEWLDEYGSKQLGDKWEKVLKTSNTPAPVFLRANRLKINPDQLVIALKKEGINCSKVKDFDDAVVLPVRKNVFQTQSFKRGEFEVQDIGSQRIGQFVDAKPGQRVVDACAGAGGKTLHIAAHMKNKGKIIALDVLDRKLDELKKRAARAGVDVIEARLIDSSKTIKRLENSADHVLLDVPCSGMGVIRRNPDSKWKLSMEKIENLKNLQREILKDYSSMVKAGGNLIYSTCSVFPEENREQVDWFLTQNANWKLERDWSLLPEVDSHDGFYAAKLLRLS